MLALFLLAVDRVLGFGLDVLYHLGALVGAQARGLGFSGVETLKVSSAAGL